MYVCVCVDGQNQQDPEVKLRKSIWRTPQQRWFRSENPSAEARLVPGDLELADAPSGDRSCFVVWNPINSTNYGSVIWNPLVYDHV